MFKYQLELEDGTPADPPTFTAAAPNWRTSDEIPLAPGRSLRVVVQAGSSSRGNRAEPWEPYPD